MSRSGFPQLREADRLTRTEIERELERMRERVASSGTGAAHHQAERTLSSWEHAPERRFGVVAPVRANRS